MDFGDAPDSYPTLFADDGARHGNAGDYLGREIDVTESDGLPTPDALGDDTTGRDDEDGVVFTSAIAVGVTATLEVELNSTVASTSPLNAWLDFNGDGDWNDVGEQIFSDESIQTGINDLAFAVPAGAVAGSTYARFRVDAGGGLAPSGAAPDGEVEDYRVLILGPPSAPTAVTGTPGNGQAAVSWTAPVYTADHRSRATPQPHTRRRHMHHRHRQLHRHRPHQRHHLHVHRHRHQRRRRQPPIHPITNVTPRSSPSAPTAVTGTAGNTQVAVSWTAPDHRRRITDHELHRNRITRRRNMHHRRVDLHRHRPHQRHPLRRSPSPPRTRSAPGPRRHRRHLYPRRLRSWPVLMW